MLLLCFLSKGLYLGLLSCLMASEFVTVLDNIRWMVETHHRVHATWQPSLLDELNEAIEEEGESDVDSDDGSDPLLTATNTSTHHYHLLISNLFANAKTGGYTLGSLHFATSHDLSVYVLSSLFCTAFVLLRLFIPLWVSLYLLAGLVTRPPSSSLFVELGMHTCWYALFALSVLSIGEVKGVARSACTRSCVPDSGKAAVELHEGAPSMTQEQLNELTPHIDESGPLIRYPSSILWTFSLA
jgi:hypothetical protein